MRIQCDTIIHAGIIVTQNKNREILKNGAIAVQGNKIAAVGQRDNITNKWCGRQVLDYSDQLLMPGLVNGHTHAAMTFMRGIAEDLPLLRWLNEVVFPLEARLTPEIVYLGSMLGYAEMLANGITACVDMYMFEDAVFRAACQAGIRCMGGEALFDFPSAAFPRWQDGLAATLELAQTYADNELINVSLNPHSVYTTTPEILKACRDEAERHNLPVHIHLAETAEESRICNEKFGMRPIAWLNANGLFERRLLAAHMVDITTDEMDFLRDKDITIVHNPASNMKLGSGISPVAEFLANGMKLALGTDGAASNNSLNIFFEMKLASLLQKSRDADPCVLPCQAALDMGTLGGAHVFGDEKLGAIAPGQKADCICMDITKPHMRPMHNAAAQLVYAANGSECLMTMVNGVVVYREGEYTSLDINALMDEVPKLQKYINKILNK